MTYKCKQEAHQAAQDPLGPILEALAAKMNEAPASLELKNELHQLKLLGLKCTER